MNTQEMGNKSIHVIDSLEGFNKITIHDIDESYRINTELGLVIKRKKVLGTQYHDGRIKLYLKTSDGTKLFYVDTLVWETINGPVPKGYKVKNIDKDFTNNRIDNLMLHRQRIVPKKPDDIKLVLTNLKTNKRFVFDDVQSARNYIQISLPRFTDAIVFKMPISCNKDMDVYEIKIEILKDE